MILYHFRVQFLLAILIFCSTLVDSQEKPETPRIDYVVPIKEQPQRSNPSTIWFDDFNGQPKKYAEGRSPLDDSISYGGRGGSMLCFYEKGKQGVGGRKVFFGDSPVYPESVVRKGEKFDEIYWRIYVRHQPGWQGSPAKMSRATSLTSSNWTQAMIAHVWSSYNSSLTLDPACGVSGNSVITRKYNDFERLKWLGNSPVSSFPIHSTSESGYWIMVECRAKLNTPGQSDGINQLWIDGRLECERLNLDFRENYTLHGINAVFLEAYWNDGSPVSQRRWFDNFVISTEPVGPVVCPSNPVIVKTQNRKPGKLPDWEFQLASDCNGEEVVFLSKIISESNQATIDLSGGNFCGNLSGEEKLDSKKVYFLRVRQFDRKGAVSDWSRWHQPFRVE